MGILYDVGIQAKRTRAARPTESGFTLIELMIVIAIIAVLAAILIPNFLHARAQSQTVSCEGNERQIATILEIYAVDHQATLPATGAVTPALFGAAPNSYLAKTPVDPVDQVAYAYTTTPGPECTIAGTRYEITDTGNHDPTTTIAIPSAPAGATSVIYCSGSGVAAK